MIKHQHFIQIVDIHMFRDKRIDARNDNLVWDAVFLIDCVHLLCDTQFGLCKCHLLKVVAVDRGIGDKQIKQMIQVAWVE